MQDQQEQEEMEVCTEQVEVVEVDLEMGLILVPAATGRKDWF